MRTVLVFWCMQPKSSRPKWSRIMLQSFSATLCLFDNPSKHGLADHLWPHFCYFFQHDVRESDFCTPFNIRGPQKQYRKSHKWAKTTWNLFRAPIRCSRAPSAARNVPNIHFGCRPGSSGLHFCRLWAQFGNLWALLSIDFRCFYHRHLNPILQTWPPPPANKINANSPGQRPNGVSDLAPRGFYHRFIDFFDNWPPAWDPRSSESVRRCPSGDTGLLQGSIFTICSTTQIDIEKSSTFRILKIEQNGILNRSWCARGRVLMKNHDFRHAFWHFFSICS